MVVVRCVGRISSSSILSLLNSFIEFRIRLPLFISAGFVLCHVFSVYLPTVEINVEVIEDNRPEDEDPDEEDEDEEYSLAETSDSDSDLDLAVFVEFVGERGRVSPGLAARQLEN